MASFNSLSILLAEDNVINQRITILMLNRIGLKCDVAGNGAEAYEMAKHKFYDLILMDMQMPVLGGIGATMQIRQYEQENEVVKPAVIVALTASTFDEVQDDCAAAGMNGFITKPFSEKHLLDLINRNFLPASVLK